MTYSGLADKLQLHDSKQEFRAVVQAADEEEASAAAAMLAGVRALRRWCSGAMEVELRKCQVSAKGRQCCRR